VTFPGRGSLAWLAMLVWSALVAGSLLWNVQREQGEMLRRAMAEARANHNKDLSFRRWAAGHGGVYVPVTATQQPVPWLAHIKDRDIVSVDGRQLTLLNPASMLRQVMDRYAADYGIRGRITGLKYLNPGNAPDPWERAKMLDFQRGLYQEATEVAEFGGQPYLRYLKKMTIENAGCIRCHAILGFTRLGEFRGAIGVNVPLAPYLAAYAQARNALLFSHGGFWLLGLVGITYAARRQGRLLARLRESEAHYRQLFDQARDMVQCVDAEDRVREANPAQLEQLGYSRQEMIGMPLFDLVAGESRNGARAVMERLRAGESQLCETVLLTRAGGRVEVEASLVPQFDADGYQGCRAIMRDIGERKAAQAEHERLQTQLLQAQKMEALGQLTGGIAHDFNNILGAVLGYTNLTLDRYRADLPEKALSYLTEVQQAGERARDLVAKMLAYSRGSRGEAQIVAVAPMLREVARMLAATLPSSLEIEITETPDLPAIRIDPLRLHQVLTNLILNARDALDGQGRVELGLVFTRGLQARCSACHGEIQGDYVELYVRDNGPGIPPDVLPRIFDPFFSTKPVGKGTGMGLAMVMGILRDARSHVLVETAPGAGAVFRLLFPPVAGKEAA
jgi:PAS domain S-box-containing protein